MILLTRRNFSFSHVFKESVIDAYEIICADISYAISSFRTLIVYRTPSCKAAETDQLFKVMSDLAANVKHVIIAGDFNIPECYPTNNAKSAGASALHELVYHHDLTQHVAQPTRGCNIPDFLFSSSKTISENLNVCSHIGASDHNSITFDI